MAIPFILTPIFIVIYLQEGREFFHNALIGNYAGQIGLLSYIFAYSRLAGRFTWKVSVIGATSMYFLSILILSSLISNLLVGLVLWALVWVMVLKTFPSYDSAVVFHSSPWWEILMRIASALTLIFLITELANNLGPKSSGAFAMYPVMTTVMSTFNHKRFGSQSAITLLHGLTQYLYVTGLLPIVVFALFAW